MIKTIFIVVHTFFLPPPPGVTYDDMFYMERQRVEVLTFDTKDALSEFLKTKCVPQFLQDACVVYEGNELEFEVEIKESEIKREITERVEVGRTVKFKRSGE